MENNDEYISKEIDGIKPRYTAYYQRITTYSYSAAAAPSKSYCRSVRTDWDKLDDYIKWR